MRWGAGWLILDVTAEGQGRAWASLAPTGGWTGLGADVGRKDLTHGGATAVVETRCYGGGAGRAWASHAPTGEETDLGSRPTRGESGTPGEARLLRDSSDRLGGGLGGDLLKLIEGAVGAAFGPIGGIGVLAFVAVVGLETGDLGLQAGK